MRNEYLITLELRVRAHTKAQAEEIAKFGVRYGLPFRDAPSFRITDVQPTPPKGKRWPVTSVESQTYIETGELPNARG